MGRRNSLLGVLAALAAAGLAVAPAGAGAAVSQAAAQLEQAAVQGADTATLTQHVNNLATLCASIRGAAA